MDERVKNKFMTSNQKFTRKFSDSITHNIKVSNYNWFNLADLQSTYSNQKIKEELSF